MGGELVATGVVCSGCWAGVGRGLGGEFVAQKINSAE